MDKFHIRKDENLLCSVCNSDNYVRRYNGETPLCRKHYLQMYRHGRVKTRTKFDKNEIVVHDNYAEIVLYSNESEEVGRALIDIEDIDKVKNIKWYIHNTRLYVVNVYGKGNKKLALHRVITNAPDNLVVDHINRNTLDNRKCNLRVCTQKENCQNRKDQNGLNLKMKGGN